MARQVTKALGNRYCQARLRAAKYNPDFATRRTAADQLPGVEEDTLKKYELGLTKVPNTVVALMVDAYNAPELKEWYCCNECPLGYDCREIEEMPSERAVIRLYKQTKEMSAALEELMAILQDGEIDREEREMIPDIRDDLIEMKRRITENIAVLDKEAPRKEAHNGKKCSS